MKALLDTNAFLWSAANSTRLSTTARSVIQDPNSVLWVSVASIWEILIKEKRNRLGLPESPESYIPSRLQKLRLKVLPINQSHVMQIWSLADIHRDPFDRIIIAQSQVEGYPIITSDDTIPKYPVTVIW